MLHVVWSWQRDGENGYADGTVDARAPASTAEIEAIRRECSAKMNGNPSVVILNWIDLTAAEHQARMAHRF